jgi:hypothetical protein
VPYAERRQGCSRRAARADPVGIGRGERAARNRLRAATARGDEHTVYEVAPRDAIMSSPIAGTVAHDRPPRAPPGSRPRTRGISTKTVVASMIDVIPAGGIYHITKIRAPISARAVTPARPGGMASEHCQRRRRTRNAATQRRPFAQRWSRRADQTSSTRRLVFSAARHAPLPPVQPPLPPDEPPAPALAPAPAIPESGRVFAALPALASMVLALVRWRRALRVRTGSIAADARAELTASAEHPLGAARCRRSPLIRGQLVDAVARLPRRRRRSWRGHAPNFFAGRTRR